jgi:FlaA1/EpsC-like NDP-sugar epimerase
MKDTVARNWDSFLGRDPLAVDQVQAAASLGGKRILVTGAGGWIGSALAGSIAGFAPEHLVLLEAGERNLYELEMAMQELPHPVRRTALLGSVTDAHLLADTFALYRPQIIYHTAAFKHVPLIEQNPFAAIENNVGGTSCLVEAAVAHRAEQLILLSTDKAADPVSMMGASKRIAELLLLARSSGPTRMKALRLGNVLGSGGSVLPLFEQQLQSGRPVTVTDPQIRRYFLTTEDAVALLLRVSSDRVSEGLTVPELGQPRTVESLARYLTGDPPARIVYTQLRPGDKMCEALLSTRESYVDERPKLLRAVNSPCIPAAELNQIVRQLLQACRDRSLSQLLEAVFRAVPEYQPSALILNGASTLA